MLTTLERVSFANAKFRNVQITDGAIRGCVFAGAEINGLMFGGIGVFEGGFFGEVRGSNLVFYECNLTGCSFAGAVLANSEFGHGSTFVGVSLGAQRSSCKIVKNVWTDCFVGAEIRDSELNGVRMISCQFNGARYSASKVESCTFTRGEYFELSDLSTTTFSDSVFEGCWMSNGTPMTTLDGGRFPGAAIRN